MGDAERRPAAGQGCARPCQRGDYCNATVSLYPVGTAGRRVAAIRSRYFSYVSRNNRVDYFGTALT